MALSSLASSHPHLGPLVERWSVLGSEAQSKQPGGPGSALSWNFPSLIFLSHCQMLPLAYPPPTPTPPILGPQRAQATSGLRISQYADTPSLRPTLDSVLPPLPINLAFHTWPGSECDAQVCSNKHETKQGGPPLLSSRPCIFSHPLGAACLTGLATS